MAGRGYSRRQLLANAAIAASRVSARSRESILHMPLAALAGV